MRLRLIAAASVLLVAAPSAGATGTPGDAMRQTHVTGGCRFTSSYSVTSPLSATGTLSALADVRCRSNVATAVALYITDGVDSVYAVAGAPAYLPAGPGYREGVGTLVWSGSGYGDAASQVAAQVAVPSAGHVYTVDAIVRFNDDCGFGPCDDYPAPEAPDAPGRTAPASQEALSSNAVLMTCYSISGDIYDNACQWQFTIVGRALPAS